MFSTQSPFERLRRALGDTPPGAPPVDLSVGSPCHAPPSFVMDVIARHAGAFAGYPPIAGTASFQRAVHDFLDRRNGLAGWLREAGAILPLNGSREGLFIAAVSARDLAGKANPAILFANPFYQTYPAAAHGIGARPVPVAAARGVLPDWDAIAPQDLDDAIAYYVASPSNPEGTCASIADWHEIFDRAERHGFLVFADECYSEIYREAAGPPSGALEAARERPGALSRLFVFNSLSKRSNLAGLRVGFLAGAAETMAVVKDLRNQAGPQVPTPFQEAAAAVLDDEAHVIENRRLYDGKFAIAERLLAARFGSVTPPAGFFLWLPVAGDDVEAARLLWREAGVRAVPGSFLAATPAGAPNPGAGHLRLALVADASRAAEALERLAAVFDSGRIVARAA